MSFCVRAPGKLFWIGEYAALDGHEALVAAVDREVEATVELGGDGVVLCAPGEDIVLWGPGGAVLPAGVPAGAELPAAVARALDDAGLRPPPLRITVDSGALSTGVKLGLGSSAAVAAAMVAAFGAAARVGDERDRLLSIALEAHRRFQGGRGSGADVVAACCGGLNVGSGDDWRHLDAPSGLRFVALHTGVASDTRERIAELAAIRRGANAASADRCVQRLGAISAKAVRALDDGEIDGWLRSVREFAEVERALTSLGVAVMTPEVERCVAVAEAAGWAAKPSGAGGGDLVVAFATADTAIEALEEGCAAAGIVRIVLSLAPVGALDARGATSPQSTTRTSRR